MRKTILFLYILAFAVSVAGYAQQEVSSQEQAAAVLKDNLNQHMALDLRDMDIVDALKFLAMKGNINIVAGKDVSGRVSLFLKDTTIKDALEIILAANNLAYEKRADILYVMTENEYKLLHGENFKDTRRLRKFKLKYTKPESVFKVLDALKSEIGKVIVDEESGTVVILDTPEKVDTMARLIVNLDRPTITKTFPLQYAKAKDVQAALSSRLDSKKTGTISADERNNQVIVTALSERMKEIEDLIKGLDKRTRQVSLEAKIIKVVLSDDFDMGVDWDKVFRDSGMHGFNLDGAFAFPSTKTNFFKIAAGDATKSYSAVLKVLQEFGETRNLSSPSIAVIDGQEANIMIGTKEAYVTTTIETGGNTSTSAAQVQFVDVGVMLRVTPTINDEGYITLKVRPEVSSVDRTINYQIAPDVTNTVPVVATTTAETTVMVKDGRTIIIGGLRKDEKKKTVDKVPFLGDIPFFGAPFRKVSEELEKQEIVVFLTPHIISGDVDVVDTKLKAKEIRGYE